MSSQILQGDVLNRLAGLPSESVHCIVTSPPYWGLRDYGCDGQIGLEKTPAEYIAKMVAVFRELRRVLRSDGTCWVNMGDGYAASGYSNHANTGGAQRGDGGRQKHSTGSGLKPKDLIGMPWRLAFALQEDGWWLRQDIIWSKPNPMPESVTDRCTKAHEYLFLLTKSARYYYDAEAIKDPASDTGRVNGRDGREEDPAARPPNSNPRTLARLDYSKTGRNKRSVWEIATQPFPEAHFATFPMKLVEPCILAGTGEQGCCSACGAPRVRVIEKQFLPQSDVNEQDGIRGAANQKPMDASNSWDGFPRGSTSSETTGWKDGCPCNADTIPCTVLDPFNGSGTTGLVATRLGRHYLGIELNPEYVAMSEKRLQEDAPLFHVAFH